MILFELYTMAVPRAESDVTWRRIYSKSNTMKSVRVSLIALVSRRFYDTALGNGHYFSVTYVSSGHDACTYDSSDNTNVERSIKFLFNFCWFLLIEDRITHDVSWCL